MVRWNDVVNSSEGYCGERADEISVCSAPMSNDSNAFNSHQFTAIRCSQFSVCGLTVTGSILCSSLPIRYAKRTEDLLVRANESPFVRIGQSNNNELCGIFANGSIRCSAASSQILGQPMQTRQYDVNALAPLHLYRVGGGTTLMPCYGGSYADRLGSVTSFCSGPCSAGFTGAPNGHNQTTPECLKPCPDGHWCPEGVIDPIFCPSGTYGFTFSELRKRSTDCPKCDEPGQYCPRGTKTPLFCPRGAYCPTSTDYYPCPNGTYGDAFGLTTSSCSGDCDPGFVCTTYSVTPQQQACPSGQYNNRSRQSTCIPCSPGTFATFSVDGTRECTNCSAGMFASARGSSTCSDCLPGHFTNLTGQALCQGCPLGTYSADPAARTCLDCAAGTYTPTNTSSVCIPCPLGHFRTTRNEKCIACPRGTASENLITGDTRCIPCSVGFHSPTPGTQLCLPCSAGTYNLLSNSTSCAECDVDGVVCSSGIAIVDKAYHGSVGISRDSNGSMIVRLITQLCPIGYCNGTSSYQLNVSAIDEYIASGQTQTIYISLLNQCSHHCDQSSSSALCGKCESGFAASDVGSPYSGCVACKDVSYLKWSLLIAVSWLFVFVYYIASNGRLGLIGTVLYYIQTISIMVSGQSSLTAWLRTFLSPISIMPQVCLAPTISPELQYAIPLFIAPLQLIQLLIIVVVHTLLKRYGSPPAYQLNTLTMTYRVMESDSNQYSREFRFPSIKWWIILIRYRWWPELTVSTICRSIFLIMTASFTSGMLTCISWFKCTDNIDVGLAHTSGSVVFAFPAISCGSTTYIAWSFVMAGYLLFWLIVIVLMLWWIIVYRHKLTLLQRRSPSDAELLSRRDQEKALTALVPMALIPQVSDKRDSSLSVPLLQQTGFACYWPISVEDEDWNEPVCVADELLECRQQYAFRSLFGAIFDSFAPNAIGWTMTILLRRLVLIILSVALTSYPSIKYTSFTFLHFINLGLHSYYLPYISALLNRTEGIAIIVHITVAILLLATFPFPNDPTTPSAILSVVVIPFITYALFQLTQKWISSTSRLKDGKVTTRMSSAVNHLETPLLPEDIELERKD